MNWGETEFRRRFLAPPNDYWVEPPPRYDREEMMKYLCLGYMEEQKWDAMSKSERGAFMDECFAYDDVLRKNGHMIGGEALQSVRTATTLRFRNGRVSITDGPFAETKEQLGGILMLEAKNLNHAIQLMAKHPAIRLGACFEVRPTHLAETNGFEPPTS